MTQANIILNNLCGLQNSNFEVCDVKAYKDCEEWTIKRALYEKSCKTTRCQISLFKVCSKCIPTNTQSMLFVRCYLQSAILVATEQWLLYLLFQWRKVHR